MRAVIDVMPDRSFGLRIRLLWPIILAGFPFIELGISYDVSVQIAVFIASLFLIRGNMKVLNIACE